MRAVAAFDADISANGKNHLYSKNSSRIKSTQFPPETASSQHPTNDMHEGKELSLKHVRMFPHWLSIFSPPSIVPLVSSIWSFALLPTNSIYFEYFGKD